MPIAPIIFWSKNPHYNQIFLVDSPSFISLHPIHVKYSSCNLQFNNTVSDNFFMMEPKIKNNQCLAIRTITWFKDSHSLFDYESTKVNAISFHVPLTSKTVSVYRKRQSSSIVLYSDNEEVKVDKEQYQFLTKFQLNYGPQTNNLNLEFFNGKTRKTKEINSEKVKTEESISSICGKEEQTYLIVRKIKNANHEQKGYKLVPGQSIKLGRVEYLVSQVKEGNNVLTANMRGKNQNNYNRKIMKFNYNPDNELNACKICLEEVETTQNFLFNPCKCSGSCGTVHFQCLVSWIHFKVKKEINGGTLHFNFNRFQCQVCKFQLPMVIDVDGEHKELLPIEKPQGNYIILEGACEKVKTVMVIQNIPASGIKLGRGHDCEIRITDISVSRNHALIKNIDNGFYIFDNKSKFGTLVKEDNLEISLGKELRGIQIGRTILNFEMKKEQKEYNGRETKTEGGQRMRNRSQQ